MRPWRACRPGAAAAARQTQAQPPRAPAVAPPLARAMTSYKLTYLRGRPRRQKEDKRVKQLRRRNKCVEYSRANRRKNRLKKAGAAVGDGTRAPPPPQGGNLAVENVRLHEQLAALQERIAFIENTIQ